MKTYVKKQILLKAKSLRQVKDDKSSKIYITPDLSYQERLHQKSLKSELHRRRTAGETNLIICIKVKLLLDKLIQWILAILLLWLPPIVVGSPSECFTNKSNLYIKQINKNMVCSPLKLLIINCQSILAKKPSFLNLINDNNPDFIVGTKSWPAVSKCS